MKTTISRSGSKRSPEPEARVDSLLDCCTHPVDVDVSVAVQRQLVIELELGVAVAKIREQSLRVRQTSLTGSRVDPGDREAVHLRSRPREWDVDDPDRAIRGGQIVPDRRGPAVAPLTIRAIAGLVPLAEVPHAVAAGVHTGEHRGPRLRRQRMGRGTQDAPAARLEDARDVGKLPHFDHRVDDIERRRVQPNHSQLPLCNLPRSDVGSGSLTYIQIEGM